MTPIYLDNNATTRVAPEVRDAILPFLEDRYGNPSSPHHFGGAVGKDLTQARNSVANLLRSSPKEIYFTSGGTESNNLALRGLLAAHPERRRIIATQVEHSAILVQCRELEKQGFQVDYLSVDGDGNLDIDELKEAIRSEDAIVTVMWANNETGVLFPIDDIAAICREHGAPLHVDGVQAVGRIPIDLSRATIDLMAISGHKFHAPKGVGALFIRNGVRIRPILWGGNQERGKRPGTEAVPLIAGLGRAADLAAENVLGEMERVRALRDRLQEGLSQSVSNLVVNGANTHRLPNTLSVCFPGVDGEALLVLMDRAGIVASSGSACLSHRLEPSHVLLAMGVDEKTAKGAVRFGLSRYTTMEEIDRVIDLLPGLVQKSRDLNRQP